MCGRSSTRPDSKNILNYKLLATEGEIGGVSDLIVDDQEMKLRYLVIDTGSWLPGKKVVLSTAWIGSVAPEKETVVMNVAAARLLPLPVLLALSGLPAPRLPRPEDPGHRRIEMAPLDLGGEAHRGLVVGLAGQGEGAPVHADEVGGAQVEGGLHRVLG